MSSQPLRRGNTRCIYESPRPFLWCWALQWFLNALIPLTNHQIFLNYDMTALLITDLIPIHLDAHETLYYMLHRPYLNGTYTYRNLSSYESDFCLSVSCNPLWVRPTDLLQSTYPFLSLFQLLPYFLCWSFLSSRPLAINHVGRSILSTRSREQKRGSNTSLGSGKRVRPRALALPVCRPEGTAQSF